MLDSNNNLCARIEFTCGCFLLNYVVSIELVFGAELYCLQKINVRYRSCVVGNEPVFVAELCCLQRISVRCQIMVSAAN